VKGTRAENRSRLLTHLSNDEPPANDRCFDFRCSHCIRMNADQWPDEMRLSDLEDKFTCTARGRRGADIRPDFDWHLKAET